MRDVLQTGEKIQVSSKKTFHYKKKKQDNADSTIIRLKHSIFLFLIITIGCIGVRPGVVLSFYETKDFTLGNDPAKDTIDIEVIHGEVSTFFLFKKRDQEKLKEREQLFRKSQKEEIEGYLKALLSGHPMENMIPFLSDQDPQTMAFLIGIAKKESNWGKHVPLNARGHDCYNYWGYKAPGSLGVQRSGYGCFSGPEEAISLVGSRIQKLIREYKRDTPGEMVIWKCGSSCSGHDASSVKKWIVDVGHYHKKVLMAVENTLLWKQDKI